MYGGSPSLVASRTHAGTYATPFRDVTYAPPSHPYIRTCLHNYTNASRTHARNDRMYRTHTRPSPLHALGTPCLPTPSPGNTQ